MSKPNYNCAQDILYIFCRNAWRLCRKHLAAMSARKPKYTEGLIAANEAEINDVDYLPDFYARYVEYDVTKAALEVSKKEVIAEFVMLISYVKDAFSSQDVDTMYKACGLNLLAEAKRDGFKKTLALMSSAVPFMDKYAVQLKSSYKTPTEKNNMPDSFAPAFKALQIQFNDLYKKLGSTDENGQEQTSEKVDLNNNLDFKVKDMLDDAASIFTNQPDIAAEFVYATLLKKANGVKQAGIKGRVLNFNNNKPVAGAVVTVIDSEKVSISDDLGRYDLSQITAGTYDLTIECEGFSKMTFENIKVKTGKISRFNFKLTPLVMVMTA